MAPRSDNISEISPVKESWSIVVRIVRAWFVRDVNRDKYPFSLDMVLMDASVSILHCFFYLLMFCVVLLIIDYFILCMETRFTPLYEEL